MEEGLLEPSFDLLDFVQTAWAKKSLCIVHATTPFCDRQHQIRELNGEACVVGDMPTHNYDGLQFYNAANIPHNAIKAKYIFIVYDKDSRKETIAAFYKTIVPLLCMGEHVCCMYYQGGAICDNALHQVAVVIYEQE